MQKKGKKNFLENKAKERKEEIRDEEKEKIPKKEKKNHTAAENISKSSCNKS